ncbi:MAG: GWxTD domain-containing protein [Gemmatimonadetes bacterium]|nr:GWxTD domain-containing protein [Gemmatimonadota bacterium]
MFTSPIVRYALLMAIALWSAADAQEDLILRTGATGQVWTYSREMSGIALTELWTDGAEREQCLGIFPGRPGQLGKTETGTIIYQSIPLLLPAPGDILHRGHTISLAPSRYWELTSSGRDILIIDDPDMESIIWTTEKAIKGLKPTAPAIGKNDLPTLTSGFNAVRLAQLSLSRWEFKQAAAYYNQAARHFETLARQSAKSGLSESPMQDYVNAFQSAAQEIRKNGSRWVCRDHLTAISRLLTAYRRDHRGKMPDQLSALQKWTVDQSRADPGTIARLFRAPADRDNTRPISYFYRPNAATGEAIVVSYFYPGRLVELVRHTENYRVQDRPIGQTQIDSLVEMGKTLLSQNDTLAVPILTALTHVAPELELGHCLLGYAYLEVENYDRARSAFERAIDLNHRLSEAYNGLGLVFQNRPKGLYNAIRYFRKALQWSPDERLSQLYNIHRDARFNMAQTRYKLKEYDTKRDLDHVIAMDPTYAPTYKLLGKWWEEQEEDYEQAAMAYARYITLAPEDPEGRELLSRAYLRSKNFDRIVQLLEDHIREYPEEITSLPILAQACLELKRPNWAQTYFSRYVAHLNPQHRALYEDIQFLASTEELEEYNSLDTDAARSSYLRQFWALKDPNLITATNERKLEHYRRVWYALTNFSEGKKPFDRRGEVYIRFGEPDYRSRSNMLNLQQSLSVQRVKERVAQTLFGGEAAQQTYFGPVYPVRGLQTRLSGATPISMQREDASMQQAIEQSQERERQGLESGGEEQRTVRSAQATADDQTGEDISTYERRANTVVNAGNMGSEFFNLQPDFNAVSVPEDASMVRWETWIYTDVNGGIEITFTDEAMTGSFDYAPAPLDPNIPIRTLALLNRYNPRRVTEFAARVTPDYYATPENTRPLEFYYDLADFQSLQNSVSALEVYTGIPQTLGRYFAENNTTEMVVERTVSLLNEQTGDVYRRTGDVRYRNEGDQTGIQGAFIPDVVRLDAPPGYYKLEVHLLDRLSGRQGRYRQIIELEKYQTRSMKVSDLELAWRVAEGGPQDKFRKGELHVVPMPTRTYPKGQSIFVYYEIYNLKRNEFGQTKYQVEYTIAPKGKGVGGAVSRLVRTLGGKREKVLLGYEQVGTMNLETVYTELELGDREPGRYALEVVITDLNSEQTASKNALFVVAQ